MRPRLSIALHGVSVRRGGKWVLRDVTWQLKPGERWALLGDNGAGKSTLIKILAGVFPPDRGELRFRGTPVTFASPAHARSAWRRGFHPPTPTLGDA